MKLLKTIPALLLTLAVSPLFGLDTAVKDQDLYKFAPTVTVEAPKVEVKAPETKVVETATPTDTKTEVKVETKPETTTTTPSALVADAQTLIKDKLVQKYQVRLDEIIGRMSNRLSTASANEQRVALADLRDRMTEKKAFVLDIKNLDPLKRDIIVAVLDHVIYRLDGILKQSAQVGTDTKVQA